MLARRCFLLAGAALVIGCRRRRTSPEEQVRDTVSALATAIEDGDLSAVRTFIAESFTSEEATDRPAAIGLLRAIRSRYPHVHLLTRVTSVDFPTPAAAHARVTVAAAAHPLLAVDDLARVSAEILVFELTFAEVAPARWQVTSAVWQPGEPRDFLDDRADTVR